jgi:hypothetical protein
MQHIVIIEVYHAVTVREPLLAECFKLVRFKYIEKEKIMGIINRTASNSAPYTNLSAVQMSAGERKRAFAALKEGELIADVILRVAHALRLLVTMPGLKPTFKH